MAVLITAIGVSYLLQNVALLIFGSNARQFTSIINLPNLKLADGRLTISAVTIVTIITCIVIMVGLTAFINKTKIGQAMLAVSEDTGAATLMGINVDKTISTYFRHWFCSGSHRGSTSLFCISVPDYLIQVPCLVSRRLWQPCLAVSVPFQAL